MKIRTGILGCTGYTGAELLRLLVNHAHADIRWITSEKFAGDKISTVFPNIRNFISLQCRSVKDIAQFEDVDIVFSCLPHTSSMNFVKHFLDKGTKFIDFSADFRFKNSSIYSSIYSVQHKHPELLRNSVYGLPELKRKEIKKAYLIANPGCFATSVVLGVSPLLKSSIISGRITVDSKTGLSGAGRAPIPDKQFSEANNSIKVNSISDHAQKYEIEEILKHTFGKNIRIIFSSCYVNISRGMLTTISARLGKKYKREELLDLYKKFYKNEPFIRIIENEHLVSTKNVTYSNYCDIALNIQGNDIICVTALDNLGKGASAQAVQNMNIMFGLDEKAYLVNTSLYP